MVLKRLKSVERKMNCNAEFAKVYKEIIDSYIRKGYARKLTTSESILSSPHTWYLPHFAVANPNKPGKLRFVFDAAAQVNGISLNSCLLKGPQEYKPLPSILFRFRERAVGLCGDIKEMFHQILIRPEDRCAQRFLWRNGDSGQPPDIYEMCVMTFGAACSPCTAHYVKTRNALEHVDDNRYTSRTVTAILENHYVDDLADSFDSAKEAITVANQVREIHKEAGFELRNFTSNSEEVIAALGGVDVDKAIGLKDGLQTERVLGLHWYSTTDCFKFGLKFNKVSEAVVNGGRCPTKRELLSVVMSIFDPLGFLGNFVIGAKLLMREVWRHETHWDDPLPANIAESWERWRKQLPEVMEYSCPRFYFRNGAPKSLQLHVFVDASENAFAAVTYWRARNARGEIEVTFICAKSKCAPLKTLTIPRLELQHAVLGARLQQAVREAHSSKIDKCFLWSDSGTVIKWIRSKHRKYKPFVQHRIAEILAATHESDWRWIPTAQNVADEATRANHNIVLSPKTRWVQGPSFLREEEYAWPTEDGISADVVHEEELRPQHTFIIVCKNFIDFDRFSSYNRLLRTTAWVMLFVEICRRTQNKNPYGLTANNIEAAKLLLCRIVQNECFPEEIQQIQDGKEISNQSPLVQLSPYLDENGVLRVRGRIDAASWLPICTRRPIILPPKYVHTKLITEHYHILMDHQNTEATICAIRREYWVPRLRILLRNVIANCKVCRLRKAAPVPPLMGPLPVDRLTLRKAVYLHWYGLLRAT
ncbi:uncharacterized protein [Eurosta solidaginis]|uniref:uncharacterized protein n=1 Tax=Eurosta solidaginis TaxID=178769 RepID=UPI003530BD21